VALPWGRQTCVCRHRMNASIKTRLTIFIAATGLLLLLAGWTVHATWRRIGELHDRLTTVQWRSYEFSDHLQQSVLGMNNTMLRYSAYRYREDWTNFLTASSNLCQWIGGRMTADSAQESAYLGEISAAFGDYTNAANAIHTKIYGNRQATIRMAEFAEFEAHSRRILDLGGQMAQTHQAAANLFQTEAGTALDFLRDTLFAALALLLAAGGWLAVVLYRELITPLQVQLVESRQLAERQEKLASLGMLATGVAHEIRNPLTAIKAWLYLQKKLLKPGTPEQADANLIADEIDRLERIVKDFLLFARPSDPQLVPVAAGQPLQEVRLLLEPDLAKSGIRLELGEVAPGHIRIDPQQIKQVLINLVRNAAESIGQNGRIILRARREEKRLLDRTAEVMVLEVRDTGKGIPPEVEKRLFDPFFTTKSSGTGLGLPIAARIVEKHQGALQYQTQVDCGTTFGVILPLCAS